MLEGFVWTPLVLPGRQMIFALLICLRPWQVVGKPCPAFFQLALSDLGVNASAAVMVGDDVRDDVQGAMDYGMAGILGEYATTVLLIGSQHHA